MIALPSRNPLLLSAGFAAQAVRRFIQRECAFDDPRVLAVIESSIDGHFGHSSEEVELRFRFVSGQEGRLLVEPASLLDYLAPRSGSKEVRLIDPRLAVPSHRELILRASKTVVTFGGNLVWWIELPQT